MKRTAAAIFLMLIFLLASCTGGGTKRLSVMGRDMSYWQERDLNDEITLCGADAGFASGNLSFSKGYTGRTVKELYDVMARLETERDEDFDTARYLRDRRPVYTVVFRDGSSHGLPARQDVSFTFMDDCTHAVSTGGADDLRSYRIRDPELIRDILRELDLYVPADVMDKLAEKTVSILSERDSLMELAAGFDRIFLRDCTDPGVIRTEKIPSPEDDFTFDGIDLTVAAFPTWVMYHEYYVHSPARYCVRASGQKDGLDIDIDFAYVLTDGEYEVYEVIVTKNAV